jgi:hypothetical protein
MYAVLRRRGGARTFSLIGMAVWFAGIRDAVDLLSTDQIAVLLAVALDSLLVRASLCQRGWLQG